MTMKVVVVLVTFLGLLQRACPVVAFAPVVVRVVAAPSHFSQTTLVTTACCLRNNCPQKTRLHGVSPKNQQQQQQEEEHPNGTARLTQLVANRGARIIMVAATLAMSTAWSVGVAASAAADNDLELAELPPPYVPVLFGLGLVVGVGLLTSSLGNVMDEESQLGMQSGARAKKERDRSRSSYFKK